MLELLDFLAIFPSILFALLNVVSITYLFYYVGWFERRKIKTLTSSLLGGTLYISILIISMYALSFIAAPLQEGYGKNIVVMNGLFFLFLFQSIPAFLMYVVDRKAPKRS